MFEVESLLEEKRETVHAQRLLLYRADMDGVVVEPALLRHSQHTEARCESAKEVRDIRNASGNIELQI